MRDHDYRAIHSSRNSAVIPCLMHKCEKKNVRLSTQKIFNVGLVALRQLPDRAFCYICNKAVTIGKLSSTSGNIKDSAFIYAVHIMLWEASMQQWLSQPREARYT